MVIFSTTRRASARRKQTGALMTDVVIALSILAVGVFPLAFSFQTEQRMLRAEYEHAVLMELVDGEMEILKAGEWRAYESGSHTYQVKNVTGLKLPPGHFQLTRTDRHLRLEWLSDKPMHGGSIVREGDLAQAP